MGIESLRDFATGAFTPNPLRPSPPWPGRRRGQRGPGRHLGLGTPKATAAQRQATTGTAHDVSAPATTASPSPALTQGPEGATWPTRTIRPCPQTGQQVGA